MSRRSSITRLGVIVLTVLLAALGSRTAATVLADPSSMSWDLSMDDPAGACPAPGGTNDGDALIETGECPDVVSNLWLQPEGGLGGSQSLYDLANTYWTTGPLGGDVTGDGIGDPSHGLAVNRPATLGVTVGEIALWINSNLSLGAANTNNVDDVATRADPSVDGQPPPCGNASTDTIEMSDDFPMWNAIVDDSNGTVSHLDLTDGPEVDTQDPDPAYPLGCDPNHQFPHGDDCAPKGVRLLPAPLPDIETALGVTPGTAVTRAFGIAKLEIVAGITSDVDVNLLVYSLHAAGASEYLTLTLVGYRGSHNGLTLRQGSSDDPSEPTYDPLTQTVAPCPPYWSSPVLTYGVTTDSDFDQDGRDDLIVTPELNRLIVGTGGPYAYAVHKSTHEDYDGDTIPAYADRCDTDPATGTATDDLDGDTMTGTCDANEDPNDGDFSGYPDGNEGPYVASPPWAAGQDVDGDTYLNYMDNCPQVADRDLDADTAIDYQRDTDGDTVGDVCEIDLGAAGSENVRGDGSGYASPAPGVFVDNSNICNDRWSIGEPEPQAEAGDIFYKYCLAPKSMATTNPSSPYVNPAMADLRLCRYTDADDDARPDFWDGLTSACSDDPTWCPNADPHLYDYFDPSDADLDGHSDGCETFTGSDSLDPSSTPGAPSIANDCDGDTTSDLDELAAGTNPLDGIDSDGDGSCSDAEETAAGLDPTRWYDFYDVPVPARPDPQANGVRDGEVTSLDSAAVLVYLGTSETGVCGDNPNGNGVDYDCDKNLDGVADGVDYDRSSGSVGPPDGIIDMADALAVQEQIGLSCMFCQYEYGVDYWSVMKTDEPDPVDPEGVITYTLRATNNGPGNSRGLVIWDELPNVAGGTAGPADMVFEDATVDLDFDGDTIPDAAGLPCVPGYIGVFPHPSPPPSVLFNSVLCIIEDGPGGSNPSMPPGAIVTVNIDARVPLEDAGTVVFNFGGAFHSDVFGEPNPTVDGDPSNEPDCVDPGTGLPMAPANLGCETTSVTGAPTPTITPTPTTTPTATDTPTPTETPVGLLESVSGTIGSGGGTLSTGSGDSVEAFLSVPPGGLAGETPITIDVFNTSDVPLPPGGGQYLSRALVFSPAGTTFAVPATVTLTYTDAEVAGLNERRLGVWLFNSVTGEWELAEIIYRDPDTNTLIAVLPHFSVVAVRDLGTSDFDADGCTDAEELPGAPVPKPGSTGAYDPLAWYDFYDVPVPANPDMTPNGPRNQAIDITDVLAVLFYAGAGDDGPANGNGVDYDSDKDGDTVEDGLDYDRTPSADPSPPYDAGPPDGAIDITDVLAALAQSGLDCSGPP